MRIFAESELREYLSGKTNAMVQEIRNESSQQLLNVNETEYLAYLEQKYAMEPLSLDFERVEADAHEKMIRAEDFPGHRWNVRPGQSYPRNVFVYHIPFTGDRELLRLRPSQYLMWSTDVQVVRNEVQFEIIQWGDDAQVIKGQAEQIIGNIRQNIGFMRDDIQRFNADIARTAREIYQSRKQEHLNRMGMLENLGVPIRRSASVPDTFAVPITKKQAIMPKPVSSAAPYQPQPAVTDETYQAILTICRHTGMEMERHPSIYQGKGEEALRDHFIMVLSPHFQSTTGETFNNAGKTDILIRHENTNVFVAECKKWGGAKVFADTIDQILSYLTWRDSKAAIIFFVKTKDISVVLDQIEGEAAGHSQFIKSFGKTGDGWFNFEFRLPDAPSRSTKLAVLCFHIPK